MSNVKTEKTESTALYVARLALILLIITSVVAAALAGINSITKKGQIIYAIGCGVLTVMIRYFGGYNEGVSYAILCMNACVVLLDRIGRPVKFGAPKKEAAK